MYECSSTDAFYVYIVIILINAITYYVYFVFLQSKENLSEVCVEVLYKNKIYVSFQTNL